MERRHLPAFDLQGAVVAGSRFQLAEQVDPRLTPAGQGEPEIQLAVLIWDKLRGRETQRAMVRSLGIRNSREGINCARAHSRPYSASLWARTEARAGPGWIRSVGRTWLGNGLFEGTTGPLMQSLLVLAVLWTFCWWLWKRKVFIRI